MKYTNLHVRSYYSLLSSCLSIDDIINFSLNNKQEYVSLIDVNMFGVMEFYTKALEAKLKPIIGIEIFYNSSPLLLIAKNYLGYLCLCEISSQLMCKNKLNLEIINLENIIVIFKNKKQIDSLKITTMWEWSDVAIQTGLFLSENDFLKFKALQALKNNILLDEIQVNEKIKNNFLLSNDQSLVFFTKKQLSNLANLINLIDIKIPLHNENHFVKFDTNYNSYILLCERCRQGLINRFKSDKVSKVYIERLKYELEVINEMGFNDYFLVVQDYVEFAKQNNILVGAGRGSASGSLVSYVLNITDLDPIKYNLVFERFLNKERQSMPDIDIDFMDSRRGEVFDYIFNKYNNKTAHIITFQRIKAKMAIRDIGRILGIELPIINLICKLIPLDLNFNLKQSIETNKSLIKYNNDYPLLFELACFIIDFPRQIGTHAAGIVISEKPLNQIIPICKSVDDKIMTQYSMEYLEPNGLIKMDILGLVNLSIINDCISIIYKNKNVNIDLSSIRLDDQNIFNQLSNGKTTGIFQLESPGMRQLILKIKPKSIEDISITSALFRPGPQENIPLYLKNKQNPGDIKYINPDIKPILESTYGVIIYQEQVIRIVCKVANFTLSQADLFRRAISKKDFFKLDNLRNDFIKSSIKNNYSEKDANEIFEYILKFANYGFNHSHSLSYSLISYQMAFLKTYYPLEFYCCLLSYNDYNIEKALAYIDEAKESSISILQPDILHSMSHFSIFNDSILFGFNIIKGIGAETIKKIILAREANDFSDVNSILKILSNAGIGVKSIELLIKAGSFDKVLSKENKSRSYLLFNLQEIFDAARTYSSLYGSIKKPIITEIEENDSIIQNEAKMQLEVLGYSFNKHPLIKIKENLKINLSSFSTIKDISKNVLKKSFDVICVINSIKKITTKNNTPMAFVKLEDETGLLEVVAFNDILQNDTTELLLNKNNLVVLKIIKTQRSFKITQIIKEIINGK